MNPNPNHDASKPIKLASDSPPMSIWAKFFVGTTTLVGAGAGLTISAVADLAIVATALTYLHPRHPLPRSLAPRGVFLGGMTGGAVGYIATVLFTKGRDYASSAVSKMQTQKSSNVKQEANEQKWKL